MGIAKELHWEERSAHRLVAKPESFWRAQTTFDWGYRIVKQDGRFILSGDHVRHETIDAAKAAAQADYDRRIRASLSPSALASIEMREEMVKALDALYLQALQSDVNSSSNEWGREALDMAHAVLSRIPSSRVSQGAARSLLTRIGEGT